jgi:HD superfamily phosphohydrolase
LRGGLNPRRLCSDISGAHNLEQILFNKILLYSSMYHHHKVRAALCMLKSIFEIIWDNNLQIDGMSFKKAVDFLSIDDFDILSVFRKEPLLKDIIEDIRNRRLLKRALVMSRKTVKERYQFENLTKLAEDPLKIKQLRELIAGEMKAEGCEVSIYDIWIDLPKSPSLREPSQCKVRITDKDYVDLAEVFPADWWLVAYSETKWKGHVFCPPNLKMRNLANKAAQEILKSVYGIEFLPTATDEAKIS